MDKRDCTWNECICLLWQALQIGVRSGWGFCLQSCLRGRWHLVHVQEYCSWYKWASIAFHFCMKLESLNQVAQLWIFLCVSFTFWLIDWWTWTANGFPHIPRYGLTAVNEMLSTAACLRGLSLIHESNGDLHSYREAMKVLLSSVRCCLFIDECLGQLQTSFLKIFS